MCVMFSESDCTSLTNGVLIVNLMLFEEIISHNHKTHTKHINTQSGQNTELMNVKYVVRIVTTVGRLA